MSHTKERIISAAIELFNEQGFVNVRLQNIADELEISVGNLAYHFKNKEAIVSTAYYKIGDELSSILSNYRVTPDLRDLDYQLDLYFDFIRKYPFYFIDILEIKRNHPNLHEVRKDYISKMVVQFQKRIEYNKSRGIVKSSLELEHIYQLADNMCMSVTFWYTYQAIKDMDESLESFKKSVWSQLYPYLTKKGMVEYSKFVSSASVE
ncbi:MAG: TetR/AcrR family transcriptional regulator [Cytophagales bacterium]|nr:TetR/AcrR family transcriptional regulator [Cytophagales bacterium]